MFRKALEGRGYIYRISIDMSSIYLPEELKNKLVQSARRRGFRVERGPQSQLGEYIEYLIRLDEQKGTTAPAKTCGQALGLLAPMTDQQVEEILRERRLGL